MPAKMTGVAMGTPSYMAPEQFFDARSVDARADLYSVSAMLYELLSGKLPFDAESYAHLIVKVRTEQAAPLNHVSPQLPVALAQVVMVGLAKEPGQRWQSAREFGEALRSAMGLPPPGNTPSFLPSQSGTQPALARPEAAAMEKTYTPQPRPSQPPASVAPATDAAWVVPSSGSANTGLPIPAPQPSAPPPRAAPVQSGWVVPPGATPTTQPLAPQQRTEPAAPPPQKGSSSLKWVAVVVGIFCVTACCTCGALVKAIESSKKPTPIEQPAPEVEVAPVADPDVAPEVDVDDPPDEEEAAPEPTPPPEPPKRPHKHK